MTDLTKLTTNEFLDLICGKAHEDIGLLEIPDYQAELRRRLTSEPTGDVAELLEKLRICLEDDSPHVGMILWRRLHLAVAALQARANLFPKLVEALDELLESVPVGFYESSLTMCCSYCVKSNSDCNPKTHDQDCPWRKGHQTLAEARRAMEATK